MAVTALTVAVVAAAGAFCLGRRRPERQEEMYTFHQINHIIWPKSFTFTSLQKQHNQGLNPIQTMTKPYNQTTIL